MNICLLGQYPPHIGGVSSHTHLLARELVKRGDNVHVLTYPHPDIRGHLKNPDGITVETAYTVNIKGLRGMLFFFSSILKLRHMVKEYDIDLIHAHFIIPPGLIAVIMGGLTKKKVAVTVHGSDIFILSKNQLLKPLIKYVLKKADIIAAVNQKVKDKIQDLGINGVGDKIELTPNAVDLEEFKPTNQLDLTKELGIKTSKPLILFVGNLVSQKGLKYLINAKIEMETPSIILIVGGGPLMKELQQMVKDENLSDVYFAGARRDVAYIMPQADLFVLPSISEGSPITLLEAFASGLPAVATDVGGVREIVTPDVGIVVPARDSRALKEAVDKILQNDKLRRDMSQAAISKARRYGHITIPY